MNNIATSIIFTLLLAASTALSCPPTWAVSDAVLKQKTSEARTLFEQDHLLQAQKIMLQVCQQSNATPEMYVLLADTFLDYQGVDFESPGLHQAEQGLTRAMQLDPEYGRVYKDMAEFCNLREQYNQAIALSTKALQVKRPEAAALRQRAMAYSHLHQYKEALADLTALMKRERPLPYNYEMKGDIEMALHDYHAAELAYRQSIPLAKSFPARTYNAIIKCMREQHKYQEAIKDVSVLIKKNPESAEAYALRGELYTELHDSKDALTDLSKAISLEPTAKYYKERAELYKTLGQTAAAEQDLKSASNANKNSLF